MARQGPIGRSFRPSCATLLTELFCPCTNRMVFRARNERSFSRNRACRMRCIYTSAMVSLRFRMRDQGLRFLFDRSQPAEWSILISTVRRDATCLQILFRTSELSLIWYQWLRLSVFQEIVKNQVLQSNDISIKPR